MVGAVATSYVAIACIFFLGFHLFHSIFIFWLNKIHFSMLQYQARIDYYSLQASFVGAMAIADLVKTTLGPKGMVIFFLL